MINKIYFQSSLPRAGSTLFQNVMAQNPDFYVTPTSGVLELVFAARNNYTNSPEFKAQDSHLMKQGFLSFCKHGVEGFFNGITQALIRLLSLVCTAIHLLDLLTVYIDKCTARVSNNCLATHFLWRLCEN